MYCFFGLGLFTCTICKHNKYSELLSQYLELKKISLVLCVPGTDRIVDHLLKYSRAKNHISALKKVAQFPRTLCWEMTRENPNFLTAANCGGANDCTEPQSVEIIFESAFLFRFHKIWHMKFSHYIIKFKILREDHKTWKKSSTFFDGKWEIFFKFLCSFQKNLNFGMVNWTLKK